MFSRHLAIAFILIGSAVVSGCQRGASSAADIDTAAAAGGAIRESELRAYCPPATLREGTAFFETYESGGQGEPDRLIYQASIGDVTRTCSYGEGTGTMTVAVAGKVVPGPKGRVGTINMPIRVVALRSGEVVYSQLFKHPVSISDTAGATQFVYTNPAIVIPGGIDRSIQLMVGYDEGPAQ